MPIIGGMLLRLRQLGLVKKNQKKKEEKMKTQNLDSYKVNTVN